MANSFGLLLLLVVAIFIVSRCVYHSSKAFTRLMACLVFGLLVGAGIRLVVDKTTSNKRITKSEVVTKSSLPTQGITSLFVLEDVTNFVLSNDEQISICELGNNKERDNLVTFAGAPEFQKIGYINDS